MSEQQHKSASEDEISLKDLILKFWEYFFYVLKQWKVIVLFVVLGLALNIYKYYTHETKYTATISFIINEDESSSIGGLGSLLGSFGGLLGGASEYNLEKILEISKSDRIAEKILLKKIDIKGKSDFIGNHLITSQDSFNKWFYTEWYKKPFEKNPEYKKLQREHRFHVDSIDFNNRVESNVLKQLTKLLFGPKNSPGEGIVTTEAQELSGIMKMSTSSYNEVLALEITNSIFDELSSFYVKKSIEKQQQTFDIMKMKHDSINNLLNSYEYQLARFEDSNRGLFKLKDQLKKDQLKREIFILGAALGEAKKNLEITDFALRDKTPLIRILDKPFLPLDNSKTGIFNLSVMGMIFGGFLGFFFVIIRKVYQDIMS